VSDARWLDGLAEQRVCTRPTSEQEARAVLERIATRECKRLGGLVHELAAFPNAPACRHGRA
jgi:hypothetical protein